MTRIIALAALIVVSVTAFFLLRPASSSHGELDIRHRYLLVSVEGPPEWVKNHRIFIRWQGKVETLPVVFRVAGTAENMHLGAATEFKRCLVIGAIEVPVQIESPTEFRVSNEFGVSFIPEPSTKRGVTGLAIASWVTVSPLNEPGKTSPMAGEKEMLAAGNTVAVQVRKLLAAGRVIDVAAEE